MAKRERTCSPMRSSKRQASILSTTTSSSSEDSSLNSSDYSSSRSSSRSSPLASSASFLPNQSHNNMNKAMRQQPRRPTATARLAKEPSRDSSSMGSGRFKPVKTDLTGPTNSEYNFGNSGLQTPTSPTTDSKTTADTFPTFLTGNVFIESRLSLPPRRWQLHGDVLEQHSTWFRSALRRASRGGGVQTKCNLLLVKADDGSLELKCSESTSGFDHSTRPEQNLVTFSHDLPSPSSSTTPDDVINDDSTHEAEVELYNQLFGASYSIPLKIPTASVSVTVGYCDKIVRISEKLSLTAIISTELSDKLKTHRHDLYTAISRNPARFLLLSIALQDKAIYTESLIHIVGTYPSWPKHWAVRPKSLPPALIKLIERKASDLSALVTETQRDLLTLTINKLNDQPVTPSASSSTEFNTWFVVNLFRDTLVREYNTLGRKTLKRGDLFRAIGKGGDAYMPYEETRALVEEVMPCVLDNLKEDLDTLKDWAKGYVEDVVENKTLVDVEKEGITWLTCVEVKKEDFYWEMEGEGEGAGSCG